VVRRRILVNTALVVGSIVTSLCLLEVGLRLYDGIPLLQVKSFAGDYRFKIGRFMYDERLGWRPMPDLHLSFLKNGVLKTETTDAYGDRITGELSSGNATRGILASGDSFTYGVDVGDGETWPTFLQNMIGTPVTNASSWGWGTDQIIMRAEDMINLLHPKTLILGVYRGDFQRSELVIDFGAYKPYYSIEVGNLVLNDVPVPRLGWSRHDFAWARGILGYSYIAIWVAQRLGNWSAENQAKQATPSGTGEKVTCLLLERLKQRVQGEQMHLMLVMVYDNLDFVHPQPVPAVGVLGCAHQLGYETVDTWAVFAKIFAFDRAKFDALFVDPDRRSHMSAAGNRLVAEAIAQRLRDSGSGESSRP